MNAPLTLGKFPLNCRSIALAVIAVLMLIAPHEASAKGGIKSNTFNPFSRAEASTITSSPLQPHATTQLLAVVAGSDTETQTPINVAALLILAIEAGFIVPQRRRSAAIEI
jgi:hypothetical protein